MLSKEEPICNILKGLVFIIVFIVTLLTMSITSFACEYEYCDELPISITDCQICLYENWDEELKEYTRNLCEEFEIEYEIVLAIIWNESRFDSDAIGVFNGYECSYGLMQIEYITFDFLNERIGLNSLDELLDPETNILAGLTILKYHKNSTDTNRQMILRYQVGEGTYSKMMRNGVYSTKTLERVMSKYQVYKDNLS